MKSREEVIYKIELLKSRRVKTIVSQSQIRKPCNCVHNETFACYNNNGAPTVWMPVGKLPREVNNYIVCDTNTDSTVQLCTLSGNTVICSDDVDAANCAEFRNKYNRNDVRNKVLENFENLDWVYENHRDIATLQWVLGEEKSEKRSILYYITMSWLFSFIKKWVGRGEK